MEEIFEVKKILKKWETKFISENQRKPHKEDIDSSPADIKEAYSRYNFLKKQKESENPSLEAWSDSLNKTPKTTHTKPAGKKEETKTASSASYLDKLGAKLFQNAKSLPLKQKNTLKKHPSKGSIVSPPVKSNVEGKTEEEKGLFEKALLLTQSKGGNSWSSTEPVIPQAFSRKDKSRSLQRKYQTASSFTSHSFSHESDFGESVCDSSFSSQKDVVWQNDAGCYEGDMSALESPKVSSDNHSSKPSHTNLLTCKSSQPSSLSPNPSIPHSLMDADEFGEENFKDEGFNFKDDLDAEMVATSQNKLITKNSQSTKSVTARKKRKAVIDYSDDSDGENQLDEQNKKKCKMDLSPTQQEDVMKTAVVETENKPNPVRKASSRPMKSENFVRLNMRTKGYRRKGKGMTGPQHKRMLWKNKMAARSSSRGDTCFKCGETGHWANKCPNKGKSNKKQPHKFDFGPNKKPKAKNNQEEETEDEEATFDLDLDLDIESGVIPSAIEAPTAPPPIDPLVNPTVDGTLPDMDELVYNGLKTFGFDSFRKGQEKAVKRILCGLSTLVVLSTGAGKSLCYQLPAYLYAQRSKCITLVISPLVSLMEDQITRLPKGVNGACFHSNMTKVQREKVLTALTDGLLHFLLVSPETIAGGGGGFSHGNHINPSKLPPVAFVCIDEAHCLSEWSHHFRPSYLRLCKVLREKFGVKCFLGLTATATLSTASDVSRHLNINDFKDATIRGQPVPDNLKLSVSRDEDKDDALIHLLQGERMTKCSSIIIYCTRRDQTDRLATLIRTCLKDSLLSKETLEEFESANSDKVKYKKKIKRKADNTTWDAESYHAGLTASNRRRVQNAFMAGKLRVVVATVAFGMGLDKSDVRAVIHYNMPKSFESYVQEIGRAGRDGKPAHCHLFLDQQGHDLCELRKHTFANTIDRYTIKKLLAKVFQKCRCLEIQQKAIKAQKDREDFPDDNVDYTQLDLPDVPIQKEAGLHRADCVNTQSKPSGCREITTKPSGCREITTKPSGCREITTKPSGCREITTPVDPRTGRLCPGHERGIPIEPTVMELDVKEEGLATLMCYLELRPDCIVENLPPVYSTCKLQCYGGPLQLQAVAKKCPPVGVTIARLKGSSGFANNMKDLEFNVIELADSMGWDSGLVKRELKLLQWDMTGSGPSKSGVVVEFTDLAFHLRAPGDLTDDEQDGILDELFSRVQRQERTELRQLQQLHTALTSVSHKAYWMCSDEVDLKRDKKLKCIIDAYFENQLVTDEENDDDIPEVDAGTMSQLHADIKAFINMYSQDHVLNSRVIARIFHGIPSPCFPAIVWGRVRRYWRSYLHVDFNIVMNTAKKILIGMRT